MLSIVFQAIKLSPRLFWQSLFQPSKVYDFVNSDEKSNRLILVWVFFLSGFLLGSGLAVPHYYLYNNLLQSILFVFAFAFAFAFTGAVIGIKGFKFTIAIAVTLAFAFVVAGAFAIAFAITFAVVGAFESVMAFKCAFKGGCRFASASMTIPIALILLGVIFNSGYMVVLLGITVFVWLSVYRDNYRIIIDNSILLVFFFISFDLLNFVVGFGIHEINSYEVIAFTLSFMVNYFFVTQFFFIGEIENLKRINVVNKAEGYQINHKKCGKVQKLSFIWGPLISGMLCLPIFLNWEPKFHAQFFVAAAFFLVMPIFILHLPDYLVCLPIWWFQRRKMLKKSDKSEKLISLYRESLLFKHEMIYFSLPGLYKIMTSFARNKEIGIKKAMEEINHIYLFTFQQKQAQKATAALGTDPEIAHKYIHFLLEEDNRPLLQTLSEKNRLAKLYLLLFEEEGKKQGQSFAVIPVKKEDDENLSWLLRRDFFKSPTGEKQEIIPEKYFDRIKFVYVEMAREKGYRNNDEMVNILMKVYHLLTTKSLKDFYQTIDSLEGISALPTEISYFSSTERMASQLKKIKEDLEKIDAIERFETKRSFMNEQKEKFESLAGTTGEIFYEPFQTIWKKALLHCSVLLAQEIKLLQGSAVLSIDLKNRDILASDKKRTLYFEIINKGQELASNISIDLQAEGPGLFIIGDSVKKLPVVESGSRKEISFDISAGTPMETTVKGTVTFSDRAREGKQVSYTFPITVLKKSAVFREIKNPYIIEGNFAWHQKLHSLIGKQNVRG